MSEGVSALKHQSTGSKDAVFGRSLRVLEKDYLVSIYVVFALYSSLDKCTELNTNSAKDIFDIIIHYRSPTICSMNLTQKLFESMLVLMRRHNFQLIFTKN